MLSWSTKMMEPDLLWNSARKVAAGDMQGPKFKAHKNRTLILQSTVSYTPSRMQPLPGFFTFARHARSKIGDFGFWIVGLRYCMAGE